MRPDRAPAAGPRPAPFLSDTRGGSFVEYLIVLGVVAIVAQLGWRKFGGAIGAVTHAEGDKVALVGGADYGCVGTLCVNPGASNGNSAGP
jgi:hypothetical protein